MNLFLFALTEVLIYRLDIFQLIQAIIIMDKMSF